MSERTANPARVVADADVLAADLLVGGPARAALDHVRAHSWVDLVASDPLLAEARTVIGQVAEDSLAERWRDRVGRLRIPVDHPPEDHPALASAYQGNAAHLLSLDDRLTSARGNQSVGSRMAVSVRTPTAFDRLFDPAALYESLENEPYPGPDRDSRA